VNAYSNGLIKIVWNTSGFSLGIESQKKDLLPALKYHLYIKKNSKNNGFKLLEAQIISYRSEENPKEIAANSAILKMIVEKDDEDISYIFEMSRRDLGDLAEKLAGWKETMDSIEKEGEI
jgi:hypothetical protein